MAGSRSKPKPKSDLKCRHCRAPNDLDATECWLCQRRDWRGDRVVRLADVTPLPERSPFATIQGLPGPDARPRQPDRRTSDPVEWLPITFVLSMLIGMILKPKTFIESRLAASAALGVAVVCVLIISGIVLYRKGR